MAPDAPSCAELFRPPRRASRGRDRLLDAAIELFYRHGFAAIGVDQVIATAGVTKSTFYKHFDGKDDLMVAAVELRDDWERAAWGKLVHERAGDDPRAQLLAVIDVMDAWFQDPRFHGCLLTNVIAEFPNRHDPVHQAAARRLRSIRDQRRAIALATGASPAVAEHFVDCFTAMIDGAIVLRLAQGRDDAARVLRPAVEQLIRALLPAAPPASRTRAEE
jgi:AcrR family transcriptional regulator